ncbi:hypothetical protein [Streptomyces sp. NPDC005752]|uniref:hypothetical protein n=1 Tax=Streptomyces sp. NPDC005752 TaxID=3157065 RepID=UPI0033C824B9
MRRKAQVTDAAFVTPEIERLADAVRGGAEPEGAERALAAFREAFSATEGAGSQRPRRRDDWRPARGRSSARVPLRVALGAALASVTLGGVALAAGTGVLPVPFADADTPERRPEPPPVVDAPRSPTGTATGGTSEPTGRSLPSPTPSASGTAHDAPPAQHVALCRVWSKEDHRHQGAAFRKLADAAGGEDAVDAYCATLDPPTPAKPTRSAHGRSKEHPVASPSKGRSAERGNGGNGQS